MSDPLADTMHAVFTPEEFAQFRKDVEYGRKSFITIMAPREENPMAGDTRTFAITGKDPHTGKEFTVVLYARSKDDVERRFARHIKRLGRPELDFVECDVKLLKMDRDNVVYSNVKKE